MFPSPSRKKDGLTEAQDAEDVFYGEGPLQRDMPQLAGATPAELVRSLADRALAYGLPAYRDDLTLVGIAKNGMRDGS